MKKMSRREFKFHYRCAPVHLHHLIFADDLIREGLLNCNKVHVVQGIFTLKIIMKRALKAFDATYGLEASQGKTPIYFGDVGGEIQERILQDTGFYKGEFPFKDLGVGMAMGPGDYAYLM